VAEASIESLVHSLMVKFLIDNGANVNVLVPFKVYDEYHGRFPQRLLNSGSTALHFAARYHDYLGASLLLNAGASVNAKDNHNGHTPFDIAVTLYNDVVWGQSPEALKLLKLLRDFLAFPGITTATDHAQFYDLNPPDHPYDPIGRYKLINAGMRLKTNGNKAFAAYGERAIKERAWNHRKHIVHADESRLAYEQASKAAYNAAAAAPRGGAGAPRRGGSYRKSSRHKKVMRKTRSHKK
jgi:hypothetical protein